MVVGPEFLVVAALLGMIPAAVAERKGLSFMGWWVFGTMLFIVALPLAIVARPNEANLAKRGVARTCPFCAELIKAEASVCRYCRRDLAPNVPTLVRCPKCRTKMPEAARRGHRCAKAPRKLASGREEGPRRPGEGQRGLRRGAAERRR